MRLIPSCSNKAGKLAVCTLAKVFVSFFFSVDFGCMALIVFQQVQCQPRKSGKLIEFERADRRDVA